MEQALLPGGMLRPILEAVVDDDRLRLDIRDRRFNVYFDGGSLMLVDGRKPSWALHFDEKYFDGSSLAPPTLPLVLTSQEDKDARAWVRAFPRLIEGMQDWWMRHPRGERSDCQRMATANAAASGSPKSDYLVLDLEYQWAQRRFDMVAAKRNPTASDPAGWAEPDLVFVEVKSKLGACSGSSGLAAHVADYQDIVRAGSGHCTQGIKIEYQNMIAQKKRLGLLDASFPFRRFSAQAPELLIVFFGIDPSTSGLRSMLSAAASSSRTVGRVLRMSLGPSNCLMDNGAAVPLLDRP